MSGKAVSGTFWSADHPDHCRSGPLERRISRLSQDVDSSKPSSIGESVAVRMTDG
jgi:hypothetical protein